jgi:hypothetical protein
MPKDALNPTLAAAATQGNLEPVNPSTTRAMAWALILAVGLGVSSRLLGQQAKVVPPEEAKAQITALLNEFLTRNSEPAEHERFWADDLVYTGSSGRVRTKPEIMKEIHGSEASAKAAGGKSAEPETTFGAEDILARPYGEIAALTFRLVAHGSNGKTEYYRNSGMFIHRDGRWQAVTWQATKVPAETR